MRIFYSSLLLLLAATSAHAQQRFSFADSFRVGAYGAAAWGDFDGDGRKDLAYGAQSMQASQPDFLNIYHNTPSGMVLMTPSLPYMPNPAIKWADLNNDGHDELIAMGMGPNGNGAATVYTYDGVGLTVMSTVQIPGVTNGALAIDDYNNDGWKDIAMTGYDDSGHIRAIVLKGGSGLSFTPIRTPIMATQRGEMAWGDFNGDGLADLLVNGDEINPIGSLTRIYENMGADSFRMHTAIYRGAIGTVDWLDYDGDGRLDFLVTGVDTSGGLSFTDLYHNDGNGVFNEPVHNLPEFGEPSAVAVADFNKDGKIDIAFGGGTGYSTTYSAIAYGTGTTTFLLDTIYQQDIMNPIVEAADYDGDGYPDLFFSNNLLRNSGLPTGVTNVAQQGQNVRIAPNPVSEEALLQWTAAGNETALLTLYNTAGQLVRQQLVESAAGENKLTISFKDLATGTYFLRIGKGAVLKVERQ